MSKPTAVYLGNGRAIVKTTEGLKLFVPTDDLSIVPHLLVGEPWEEWITDFVKKHVVEGMTVVEVGACVGWYTTLLGRIVGPHGHVHAFEAVFELSQLVRDSLDINGLSEQVTMVACGVSDFDGIRSMNICSRHRGESSFCDRDLLRVEKVETQPTNVISLDTYFLKFPRQRPGFIKIDAEGSEPAILRGASKFLDGPMRVLFEWNPRIMRGCDEKPAAFLEWLDAHGFVLSEITPDGQRPVDRDRLLRDCVTEIYAEKA